MSGTAFDTLRAARRLKAAGIKAEHADAIVDAMGQSANQLVTVEHFDAGLSMMQSRIDAVQTELNSRIDTVQTELTSRIDTVQTELTSRIDAVQVELISRVDTARTDTRAEIARSQLISVGIIIGANALMATILGILLTGDASL